MSTSVNPSERRAALRWTVITLLCAALSAVYEHFSHGVYSDFMVYLFLFPLLGGLVPALCIWRISSLPTPSGFSYGAWRAGIATLTVGSFLRGVFDIYGTTAPMVNIYWGVGTALAAVGVLSYAPRMLQPHAQPRRLHSS